MQGAPGALRAHDSHATAREARMLVTSITTVLQEALAVRGEKHLVGNIKAFDDLFKGDAMTRLAEWHKGCFSFLAFHPHGDKPVVQYLKEETLPDDSGDHVLCLFTLALDARAPTVVPDETWTSVVEITAQRSPSALMVSRLFAPDAPPTLPGVLFFGSFGKEHACRSAG